MGEEVWLVDPRQSMGVLMVSAMSVSAASLGLLFFLSSSPVMVFWLLGLWAATRLSPIHWIGLRRTAGGVQTCAVWSWIGKQPIRQRSWGDCQPANDREMALDGSTFTMMLDYTPVTFRVPQSALPALRGFVEQAAQAQDPSAEDLRLAAQVRALSEYP